MTFAPYLTAGFDLLKNEVVTIGGSEIDCILNAATHRDKKRYGFEAEDMNIIIVRTSDLTAHPRNHLKELVLISNESWVVAEVTRGAATTTLTLVKP